MKERKNRNARKYKFTDKSQSVGGILATMVGILATGFLISAVSMSYRQKGSAGMIIGLFGIVTLFLSAIGLYLGLKSFKEENIFYHFSWVGTIWNAVLLIGMGMTILIGI